MTDRAAHESVPLSDTQLGDELQGLEVSQFTFPDDASLEVPALQVMRASLHIAETLGCTDSIWDLNATRLLNPSDPCVSGLPPNMWPTKAQTSIPHHPLFDILPWPSVRERLIYVFKLPPSQRPPAARDPNAVANIVYDIDDPTAGFRVVGGVEFDPDNWEVGQAFFKNWWWALDRAIVARSNSMRAARGLQALKMELT